MANTPTIVAYYRVSTAKQGESGLGLEGQRKAVQDHATRIGAVIIAEYTEIESGTLASRPELAKAIAMAKRVKATLTIAKLDRLARNVAFVSTLMDSGCDFCACDTPYADRFTLHIHAAVAEQEAKRISERTKAALQAAKARGVKLGSARPGHWDGREHLRIAGAARGSIIGAKVRSANAIAAVADLIPEMRAHRMAGKGYSRIADAMNGAGHRTMRGNLWTASGVRMALLMANVACA